MTLKRSRPEEEPPEQATSERVGPPSHTGSMDQDTSFSDELREAGRRIGQHPGYREHRRLEVLAWSLRDVFVRNRDELLALLESAATDWRIAFELVQNAHEPTIRDRFYSELTQRLHNYLACSASLVEHVRWLMRGRDGRLVDEFERRKAEAFGNPELPFIADLRVFTNHRTLPFFAHSMSVTNVNTPEAKMESEVKLNTVELLAWSNWRPASRDFLRGRDQVELRPVVRRHAELMIELNAWLLNELAKANGPALEEANALVIARNAILTGGDLEAAAELTRRSVS